jgi:hypothetical protein
MDKLQFLVIQIVLWCVAIATYQKFHCLPIYYVAGLLNGILLGSSLERILFSGCEG